MSSKVTPSEQLKHLQRYNERSIRSQREHLIRRMCHDSRWPFTGDLRPQEIACMRDTYCGKRKFPSCLQRQSPYDASHYHQVGWKQGSRMDSQELIKESQLASKKEDQHRNVVICANSIYGHYIDRFIDFTYRDHGHYQLCKHQFSSSGPISTLPPIKDLNIERI